MSEEAGDIAAIRGIPEIFSSPPRVSLDKPGVWQLSNAEFSNFLVRVSQVDQLEDYKKEREELCSSKGMPYSPFIVAVGTSWSDIRQYVVVVSESISYTFTKIREALSVTYEIYWALFLPYPVDFTPCWLVIQRCIYGMTTKYDDKASMKSVKVKQVFHDIGLGE